MKEKKKKNELNYINKNNVFKDWGLRWGSIQIVCGIRGKVGS